MGRRSSKPSHAAESTPGFDTMGMTILPGVSMPQWAQSAQESEPGVVEASTPASEQDIAADLVAQQQAQAQAAQAAQVAAAATAAGYPPAFAPPAHAAHQAPAGPVPAPQAAPEPAFAMAGMAMAGAAMAGAAAAAPPAPPAPSTAPASGAPHQPADFGAMPPSRYPAAPAAGLAPSAPPAAAAAHAGSPAGPQMSTYAQPGYAPAAPTGAPSDPAAPMGAGPQAMQAAPGTTQTVPAPATPSAPAAPTPGQPLAPPPPRSGEAPTQAPLPAETWRSAERPELSPEHVALLSWWADMIAAGQFPPPPGADGPPVQPARPERRGMSRRALAITAGVLAAVGIGALAVTVGPKVFGSDEATPVVPATEVTLPSAVGGLVVVTDPQVGDGMRPLLGFGVRPAGVTVTSAYGIDPAGPLSLAAMATTIGEPADDAGQIGAWSQRTGSVVGEPVVGTGDSQGITCVTAAEAPSVPAGAFCVWTGTGMRGQTFAVAMTAEDAQALTTQLRAGTTSSAEAAAAASQ